MRLLFHSIAFGDGDKIDTEYTCDGENISPSLSWSYESKDVKSFSIICEDLDAPNQLFTHWILFNIPGNIRELLTELSDMKLYQKE